MSLPVSPRKLWKSQSALRRTRELALSVARSVMRERATACDGSRAVFASSHGGAAHCELFRAEFPAVLAELPDRFTAIEWGAGMGWVAAMVAATGRAGHVIASEMLWGANDLPTSEANAHTLYRLAHEEARLHEVLQFRFDAAGELRRVGFRAPLHLLRADAQQFPAADATADLLYSINCLEHIPSPARAFAEAARVLRPGGLMFHTTEPLYYSPMGHHLLDIFPLPWGHLLWEAEELAALAVAEAGAGREWAPGVPLAAEHLLEHVFPTLNGLAPDALRSPLLSGPWQVLAWLDISHRNHHQWYEELRPWEALHVGHDRDAMLLTGLRFRLRRTADGEQRGLRTCLRLGHLERAALRQ